MLRITLALLLAAMSFAASAAPLEMLGVRPGSVHRMALGGGEITARVINTGKEGWVQFSIMTNDARWRRGTELWINLDRIDNISAPTGSETSIPAPAPAAASLSEAEIARLPCFSQVDARDAQAQANGQPFDRNQFLTECIVNQRKKP